MKAVVLSGIGKSKRFAVVDKPTPKPEAHQVLVKVHAASVNPKDWKLNTKIGALRAPFGTGFAKPVLGDDLAGTVVEVGSQVKSFKIGDRVYGMDMRLHTVSLAEFAIIDEVRLAPMPSNLSFNEAAAYPLAAQTALQGLRQGGAGEGSAVLIIGASGGVGTFAVQIAKAMGCHVTAVCSGRNAELVSSLGADVLIDYTAVDFKAEAGQFDMIFDVTSYETPGSCKNLMKENGHFVSTMGHMRANIATRFADKERASIVTVESWRDDLDALTAWTEGGQLKPIIDSTYPLAQSKEAYQASQSGRARGKIVIEVCSE
ncbi:MAG: NAD(P)-dependent alcohol dehydrogenase [Alphaproteobacteria bacterium]